MRYRIGIHSLKPLVVRKIVVPITDNNISRALLCSGPLKLFGYKVTRGGHFALGSRCPGKGIFREYISGHSR
jgi:hypothetical protein